MRGSARSVLVVIIVGLTALACQLGGGGDAEHKSNGGVLLSDDFSSIKWGTGTDADSSVEFLNESLHMVVYTENFFVWSKPSDDVYENVHMEVTVLNNGTDLTTAFGLICNLTDDNFYYFGITPAGQYAIALASEGEVDVFLTNDDTWGDSDLISVNADSYRVGADCGKGILNLYVDGQVVATALNDAYLKGQVGVFTWSDVDAVTTDISFDDFVMTALP
jgi:hypothetical protein